MTEPWPLPPSFDWKEYAALNYDLRDLGPQDLAQHYRYHGSREGRPHAAPPLPIGFSPAEYRAMNWDLRAASDAESAAHYRLHGAREGRAFRDPSRPPSLSDDAYLTFSDLSAPWPGPEPELAIVTHELSLTGAPHYACLLARAAAQRGLRVALLHPAVDVQGVVERYGLNGVQLLPFQGPRPLLVLLRLLKPRLAYFNSGSSATSAVVLELLRARVGPPVFLHSHESSEHFVPAEVTPDAVVSERIAAEWARRGRARPAVLPPFVPPDTARELAAFAEGRPRRESRRLCAAMCGSLTERKGYKIFAAAAALCTEVDWIWVGGDKAPDCFEGLANVRHVLGTPAPHRHLVEADVFVLTSDVDPCPYVVIECLVMGLPVIVWSENILTDHDGRGLRCFQQLPGSVNAAELARAVRAATPRGPLAPQAWYASRYFGSIFLDWPEPWGSGAGRIYSEGSHSSKASEKLSDAECSRKTDR